MSYVCIVMVVTATRFFLSSIYGGPVTKSLSEQAVETIETLFMVMMRQTAALANQVGISDKEYNLHQSNMWRMHLNMMAVLDKKMHAKDEVANG
jgi:hypothetical protein